jgi:hypothetical protein
MRASSALGFLQCVEDIATEQLIPNLTSVTPIDRIASTPVCRRWGFLDRIAHRRGAAVRIEARRMARIFRNRLCRSPFGVAGRLQAAQPCRAGRAYCQTLLIRSERQLRGRGFDRSDDASVEFLLPPHRWLTLLIPWQSDGPYGPCRERDASCFASPGRAADQIVYLTGFELGHPAPEIPRKNTTVGDFSDETR